jgi:hypothetical protein
MLFFISRSGASSDQAEGNEGPRTHGAALAGANRSAKSVFGPKLRYLAPVPVHSRFPPTAGAQELSLLSAVLAQGFQKGNFLALRFAHSRGRAVGARPLVAFSLIARSSGSGNKKEHSRDQRSNAAGTITFRV